MGDYIQLEVKNSDWRDYLIRYDDDGDSHLNAIHAGDMLELWFNDQWQRVRYESFDHPNRRAFLYFAHPDGSDGIELSRYEMKFRWIQQ
jgi:ABC-type uncharacterized transport system permease subunit